MDLNKRLPRIDTSRFSMVPRGDVPRSKFKNQKGVKTTFDFNWLVPIMVKEVLPGDVHHAEYHILARLGVPLQFPLMDNLYIDTFAFFVPNRIVWTNWVKMMGERRNPGDSISYTVPTIELSTNIPPCSLYDYMGLPTGTQLTATKHVSALPLRMYNKIWNDWFRDQNLQNSVTENTADTNDLYAHYTLLRRNKRHDYFTSALPSPQKGTEIGIPLNGSAPVYGLGIANSLSSTAGSPANTFDQSGGQVSGWTGYVPTNASTLYIRTQTAGTFTRPNLYADLSSATGATINALRLAFQTQALLERDMRGGTRYTELLVSHFGVRNEDSRMQRPEYIGGGRTRIETQAIPQTSATGLTGGNTGLGALGGVGQASDRHSFTVNATEHGYIIVLANAYADITYQQGLHRSWTRSTRYDFYWPAFANLGEQAIRMDELYVTGQNSDLNVFGYQERWAEYKHEPSVITGLFKAANAANIDEWHASQVFPGAPALNTAFIQQDVPVTRFLQVGGLTTGMQVLFDSVFDITSTRAIPMYSIPAQMGRF